MLMLSGFSFPKEVQSVGCGSAGCDASNNWSFGGHGNKCCDKVPDINLRNLGSTLDFPKKHKIFDKGINW